MKLKLFYEETEEVEGTYVCANVSHDSQCDLYEYCIQNNIPEPVEIGSFHCTLMYSKNGTFAHDVTIHDNYSIPVAVKVEKFEMFGEEKNCLVAVLEECELDRRNQELNRHPDLEHSFEDFRGHVTLTYEGSDIDIKNLPPLDFDIVFSGEKLEKLS